MVLLTKPKLCCVFTAALLTFYKYLLFLRGWKDGMNVSNFVTSFYYLEIMNRFLTSAVI